MIKMPNAQSIEAHQAETRNRIAKAYGIDVEKASQPGLSPEEFEKAFPSEKFDFFTEKAIEDYRNDFMKSEDADDILLKSSLDGLQKVDVATEGGVVTFYAKEKEAGE